MTFAPLFPTGDRRVQEGGPPARAGRPVPLYPMRALTLTEAAQ